MSVRIKLASIALLACLASSGSAHASLVGNWNFSSGAALVDTTGNFGALALDGNASVSNGALNLSGSGASSTGWAQTTGYAGPSISSKTMVVWGTLTGLQASAYAGAMMSISAGSFDQFDAIDYGEQQANTWINGSSNFTRTRTFSPGYTETSANLNTLFEIAYTYSFTSGGNEQITGYIDGVEIGSYTTGNAATWVAGNTIVGFGPRSLSAGVVSGGIDATIGAAQLYNTALTQAQIQGLADPASVPEPASIALLGTGLLGLARLRRRRYRAVSPERWGNNSLSGLAWQERRGMVGA